MELSPVGFNSRSNCDTRDQVDLFAFLCSLMANSVPKHVIRDVSFLGSFPKTDSAPHHGLPEFAFIGRSNVGKSSLINYLCDRRKLAKTSSTPGKTQLINLFNVDDKWVLADLPGYGYARISKKKRATWRIMINTYLGKREELASVFLLLDMRHEPQESDVEQMRWLAANGVPFSLVFTKCDKLKPQEKIENLEAYKLRLQSEFDPLPNYFLTSAEAREGREDLIDYILYIMEML